MTSPTKPAVPPAPRDELREAAQAFMDFCDKHGFLGDTERLGFMRDEWWRLWGNVRTALALPAQGSGEGTFDEGLSEGALIGTMMDAQKRKEAERECDRLRTVIEKMRREYTELVTVNETADALMQEAQKERDDLRDALAARTKELEGVTRREAEGVALFDDLLARERTALDAAKKELADIYAAEPVTQRACPYGGEVWAPEHVTGGQWDPRVKCGELGQLCSSCVRDSNLTLASAILAARDAGGSR